MVKVAVSTLTAPKAIGPYSQAIRCGNLLFVSGQIALDAETGALVGSTIEEQTEKVLKNVSSILKCQSLDWDSVVKVTVFLKNMSDFPNFNEIYGRYLNSPYPARATVAVAGLPKDALVEVEVLAYFQS